MGLDHRFDGSRDQIALVALIVGLGNAAWSVAGYVRGAETVFYAPQSVTFRCSRATKTKGCLAGAVVQITGTTMDYINAGRAGYNAVVRWESVKFALGGRSAKLDWWWFSDITDTGSDQEVAGPVVIRGASAESPNSSARRTARPCADSTRAPSSRRAPCPFRSRP